MLQISPAAQAIMGEDYLMLKTYYNHPQKYTKEHEARLLKYAKLRVEMHPAYVHLFANSQGKINKQYWSADGSPWNQTQADKIRDTIMQRSPSGFSASTLGQTWFYSDGARVTYRMSGGRVFSILAVDKDFSPGDQGRFPEWFIPQAPGIGLQIPPLKPPGTQVKPPLPR
ncbi:hypothetical protein COW36_13935 [bacterium (Candidatus Blackallbacteria) CG17_big_fil_post_rev_8_21_14_2_50_48_46]|uniref:Uncharacterized protein n=1 Tax=bacterium (Candidatus Blackallbacteria) CG17_big_fil_post_rev_8_21_14_2_50_48_46 TaxID=2014261 RepID=A0A2M7G3E5_9BACT|nr:MAG: hypothetical protein COW64_23405 [bacterium (Candidatus Blackallbacteria) CG18_big_fil_WC_8_21_14_2_50_49_26]PIW16227.1 MAG: hypothetical protein COW36_13935 [bacterium (Candidatus Blackallbacteria) CG17_big_fil_post_rev_8_21_14_2_50_48_46]PIW49890.1 MAG: hypothetical protein COW20_04370 [bacterium (Candidatus Blackallbacteria) CG13_big_fil_rev_8_21_14_2_50_49_14]